MWTEELAEQYVSGAGAAEPDHCHDKDNPRATAGQYVAMIGTDVAGNLEGVALARQEKCPPLCRSDAEVHEAYLMATTGGGAAGGDVDVPKTEPQGRA